MSDIEAQNGSADCDLDERTELAQQLLNPKMEDMQKSTGIEMRDAQNPPPGVQSGISNFNYQPQPCDTTTPASSPDYNQENDRTQPTKVPTFQSRNNIFIVYNISIPILIKYIKILIFFNLVYLFAERSKRS